MSEPVCECTFFDEGEWVESRLNPDLFGIVVSNSEFGRLVHVQLATSLEVRAFYAVTLQHCVDEDEPPAKAVSGDDADNVIRVDFTKGVVIDEDTKTEGAA